MVKSSIYRNMFSAFSLATLLTLSCSKKLGADVSSGTSMVPVTSSNEANLASSNSHSSNSTSADQVKRDVVDNSKTFEALLAAEKDERIKEDKAINDRIDVLDKTVTALSQRVTDEVARLDKSDVDILAKIEANAKDFNSKLSTLSDSTDLKLTDSLAKLKASLQDEIKQKIASLDDAQTKAKAALEKQLTDLIAQKDQEAKDKAAELDKKITELKTKQDADKAELKKEYSDKISALGDLLNANTNELQSKMDKINDDLKQQIKEMSESQKSANEDLYSTIALVKQDLQKNMDAKVAALDAAQNSARKDLEDSVNAKYSAMETNIKVNQAEIQQSLTDLTIQTAQQKADLQKQIDDKNIAMSNLLKENLADLASKLTSVDAKLAAQISAVADEQAAFKEYVASTYATKAELQRVDNYAKGIMAVTNILGKRIDDNDANIRNLLSTTVVDLQRQMASQIASVDASLAGLRGEFLKQVANYQDSMRQLASNMNATVDGLRSNMVMMKADILNNQNALRDQMTQQMAAQAAAFESTAQRMKQQFADKITEIDNKVDQTDADVQKARLDAQKALNDAIAQEQSDRNKIQEQLNVLTNELSRLAKVAEQTQALTQANSDSIKKLQSDFEQEKASTAARFKVAKEDLDKKLADVKNDLQNQLNQVSQKAADMVKNLGDDVQKHFSQVAVDLAQLEQKEVATAATLNQFMVQLGTNAEQQAQFEHDVVAPRQDSVAALSNLIKGIEDTQIAFIAALNPNQAKPDFYNDSFKPIMVKCGGNSAASFANAFGYDSFQLLAQEYVQQLVFGTRGTIADSIFFSQAVMLNKENLHKLTALAALRYTVGSDTASCIQDIQGWARDVLFSNNANSAGLRAKLALSASLQRSVLQLRDKIKSMEDPLNRLEAVIVASLKGQQAANALLQSLDPNIPAVLPRYAISLMEAAQNQYALAERQNTYNRIVSVQEQFGKNDAQLAKDIAQQKQDMQTMLNNFAVPTNKRLDALESKVGNMEAALKKALDVVVSLAARNGFTDLKAYALQAGSTMSYTPTIIPQFTPAITEVQHFFGAPALANSTDACTGNTVIHDAGVHTYYQNGGWNACWVNYRTIPSGNWVGAANTLWFRVFGAAHKIRVAASGYDNTFDFREESRSAGATLKSGAVSQGVFDMNGANVLTYYIQNSPSWDGTVITFTPSRLDGANAVTGASLNYRIQLYSPLVLDFMSVGMPKSLDQNVSKARFDLQASGNITRHGWISGNEAAFLALDKDGSKKITNGAQLFGQATKMPDGSLAKNGYEALAQYDSNLDGKIDAQDAIYNKLVVWFDNNANGISEASEVKTLREVGVTSIGVGFEKVALDKQFNAGNSFQYQAKFWGPKSCPASGCNSYDVYFGTSVSLAKGK